MERNGQLLAAAGSVIAAVVGVIMAAFARWFEEPTPLERFGDEYAEYRQLCQLVAADATSETEIGRDVV
jgi:hypothetical protein